MNKIVEYILKVILAHHCSIVWRGRGGMINVYSFYCTFIPLRISSSFFSNGFTSLAMPDSSLVNYPDGAFLGREGFPVQQHSIYL